MPVTIREVANAAGVSTATVSRVISGAARARPDTRARVLQVVQDLGYRPSGVARSLKLRTTNTLGLIVTDIQNPYFPDIVRAIDDAARDLGDSVLLGNAADDPDREAGYLELLVDRRVDGIIIAASALTARHAGWLATAPLPVVVVNSDPGSIGIPAILSDNRGGGELAMRHLLDLGHRRIGIIAGPEAHAAAQPRIQGAREAWSAAGHAVEDLPVVPGGGRIEGGERAVGELLALAPSLTAVVCYNDLTAIGAVRGLRAAGRSVPGDVSVVGFDDIDAAAWVDPPLTTIVQQKALMGRWAVDRIAERIAARASPGAVVPAAEVVTLPVLLQVRSSTAPPPAEGSAHAR